MASDVVKKGLLYLKEIQDLMLFGAMSNSRLNAAFLASPYYYVVLPMMGGLLSIFALFDAYDLVKASNRNLDKWLQFLVSAFCALLANVSIYGVLIAAFYGVTFAAAPWLFLSSVLIGTCYQLTMVGIDVFRAFMSPTRSSLQMHFVQSALNHIFLTLLMMAITGCVAFVMLSPIAPILGTAFAVVTVSMVGASLLWRVLLPSWKEEIKRFLNISKPVIGEIIKPQDSKVESTPLEKHDDPTNYTSFFAQRDYAEDICTKDFNTASSYILRLIETKINRYDPESPNHSDKIKDKIAVLGYVAASIQNSKSFTKNDLIKSHPQAFQSFWLQTGEVEAIVDAALILMKHDNFKESHSPIP